MVSPEVPVAAWRRFPRDWVLTSCGSGSSGGAVASPMATG